ncbi:MAG: UDP-glucose 4-epimerase GalE [Burkholderiales bacterium]|nr:UDP-glucose 4-epimerase GalE [Burkholderiales bacterium]
MPQPTILVTGGAGYIGSHTCVALLAADFEVVILDDLSNSHEEAVRRVERIAGRSVHFYRGRVQDGALLGDIIARHRVSAAIHFAAFKAVGESVAKPLDYYENNLGSLTSLVRALDAANARHLVFSSSATVYGDPQRVPIVESDPVGPTNPYGRTKLMAEQILLDLAASDPRWKLTLLRYFNPVGAHESGTIGEDPQGIPNNLMPFITKVAVGALPELRVFGGDWPTPDGTGVRDYIHVMDLAEGHVKALSRPGDSGTLVVNLGTGRGYSVLDVVQAFERASGRPIPYRIVERRSGDVATVYADPAAAARELGWAAQYGLDRMCADSWRWQSANPTGYQGTDASTAT